MDVSAVEDPVQRRALETMIKTYGQTPRQLFHTAHVSRSKPMEGELPAAMGLLVQFAFRETREHTKEIVYPVCFIMLPYLLCNRTSSCKVLQCNRYTPYTYTYTLAHYLSICPFIFPCFFNGGRILGGEYL